MNSIEVETRRLLDSISIPEVDPQTKFWMLRTNHGYFYDEFKREGYVGLGWNIITKEKIFSTKTEAEEKILFEEIKQKYKGIKQAGRVYSKCKRFINEIEENDIIMMPSANSAEITFALAGEYYEEKDLKYSDEIETLAQIDEGWDETISIKCPYKKRRKLKILKTISGSKINPNLYRALVSYHSLSDISDYSDYILSSVFNIYYWDNKINYVFNIEKEKEINPIDISMFIMSFAELTQQMLIEETDIDKLNGKMNINSPGDILLTLQNCANSIFDFITSNKLMFIVIWISINGGSIKLPGGFELSLNSLLEMIYKFREQNNKFKNDKLNRSFLEKKIDILSDKSNDLHINKDNINNVIDMQKYLNPDD